MATKTYWDWSTAGQDLPENHYTYLKIKGSFVYETDITPHYLWFNGNLSYRYLLGDTINPTKPTVLDQPAGSINDPQAKIFPFKVHVANQPYDTIYKYLLQPITAGENGYWTNFIWDNAFRLAVPITGLDYSGKYGFAETWMYWPTTHMVQPAENALQCTDCHSENGRLDWVALGYPGDPMVWGRPTRVSSHPTRVGFKPPSANQISCVSSAPERSYSARSLALPTARRFMCLALCRYAACPAWIMLLPSPAAYRLTAHFERARCRRGPEGKTNRAVRIKPLLVASQYLW